MCHLRDTILEIEEDNAKRAKAAQCLGDAAQRAMELVEPAEKPADPEARVRA